MTTLSLNDAEKTIIGMILNNPDLLMSAIEMGISPNSFENPALKAIWNAFFLTHMAGMQIDLPTIAMAVSEEFRSVVIEVASDAPHTQNFKHYVDEVIATQWRRNAVSQLNSLEKQILNHTPFTPLTPIRDEIMSVLERLSQGQPESTQQKPSLARELLDGYMDVLERRVQDVRAGKVRGISSGYKAFDSRLGGWMAPNLIILAARPGVGKTALALNFHLNAARQGKHSVYFSAEVNQGELLERIISADSGVTGTNLRAGVLNDKALDLIAESARQLHEIPGLEIPVFNSRNIDHLETECRNRKRRGKLDLVIVENLQQLRTSRHISSQVALLNEITLRLKGMAKELDVPVIALSHINREVDKLGGEPCNADLKGSSSIEGDADIVMFLYKEEDDANEIVIKVSKNRSGPIGILKLKADLAKNRFYEV